MKYIQSKSNYTELTQKGLLYSILKTNLFLLNGTKVSFFSASTEVLCWYLFGNRRFGTMFSLKMSEDVRSKPFCTDAVSTYCLTSGLYQSHKTWFIASNHRLNS